MPRIDRRSSLERGLQSGIPAFVQTFLAQQTHQFRVRLAELEEENARLRREDRAAQGAANQELFRIARPDMQTGGFGGGETMPPSMRGGMGGLEPPGYREDRAREDAWSALEGVVGRLPQDDARKYLDDALVGMAQASQRKFLAGVQRQFHAAVQGDVFGMIPNGEAIAQEIAGLMERDPARAQARLTEAKAAAAEVRQRELRKQRGAQWLTGLQAAVPQSRNDEFEGLASELEFFGDQEDFDYRGWQRRVVETLTEDTRTSATPEQRRWEDSVEQAQRANPFGSQEEIRAAAEQMFQMRSSGPGGQQAQGHMPHAQGTFPGGFSMTGTGALVAPGGGVVGAPKAWDQADAQTRADMRQSVIARARMAGQEGSAPPDATELARIVAEAGIDLDSLPDDEFDKLLADIVKAAKDGAKDSRDSAVAQRNRDARTMPVGGLQ